MAILHMIFLCSLCAYLQLASSRQLIRHEKKAHEFQSVVLDADGLHKAAAKIPSNSSVHFIYTVGCDEYELIQSVGLDHSWKEQNRGKLTRIVGGCKDESARKLLGISPLSDDPNFAVFFAKGDLTIIPQTGKRYPARARPYSISMWLEEESPDASIIAILDPDMIWMRPLSEHPHFASIRPGLMLAQRYAHGDTWIQFAQAGEPTPTLSHDDAWKVYATGPPWVLEVSDLKSMLPDWGRYSDAQKGDGLMREQNAFNMAAFKHGVPSFGSTDLMVSAPGADGGAEEWDELNMVQEEFDVDAWKPFVLHYCQSLSYKSWQFDKRFLADGWYGQNFSNGIPTPITCGAPLPEEPPAHPTKLQETDLTARQSAYMLSQLLQRLSSAFKATRRKRCGPEDFDEVGLMRLMRPVACLPDGAPPQTRYRVQSQTGSWEASDPSGQDKCSKAAQMMRVSSADLQASSA